MEIFQTLNNFIPYFTEIAYSLITLLIAYLVNRLVFHKALDKFAQRTGIEEHYTKPFKRVISAVVYVTAALVILSIFGLRGSLTSLLAGAGFLGIVVGMATKDVLSGVISGMVLYIDRPFKIGDWIQVGDEQGIVQDLSMQTTRIKTFDGELVTVPNSKVMNSVVINKTAEPMSRLEIKTGVDYDTDLKEAIVVCQEVLESEENISDEPGYDVLIEEFGDSSINLKIRFWVDRQDLKEKNVSVPKLQSSLRNRLLEKFRTEGIEIPFPHVEIIEEE